MPWGSKKRLNVLKGLQSTGFCENHQHSVLFWKNAITAPVIRAQAAINNIATAMPIFDEDAQRLLALKHLRTDLDLICAGQGCENLVQWLNFWQHINHPFASGKSWLEHGFIKINRHVDAAIRNAVVIGLR